MSLMLVQAGARLRFDVIGVPQTAGSKTAIKQPDGRVNVVESGNREAKRTWRGDIRDAATRAIAASPDNWWQYDGPVLLTLTFHRARPQGHFGSGRNARALKPSAPRWPLSAPDLLKMARAVEDALQGVVYVNDAQIVEEILRKDYGPPGVAVEVVQLG